MDMSADGRVIPGTYDATPDDLREDLRAFLWEEGRGWVDLHEAYRWLFGENTVDGASYISADGRYILVGIITPPLGGYRLGAYAILDRFGVHGDVTGDDCVDDADLLAVLFAFGEAGWRPADLNLDRVVDEQDLLMVLSRFGECAN